MREGRSNPTICETITDSFCIAPFPSNSPEQSSPTGRRRAEASNRPHQSNHTSRRRAKASSRLARSWSCRNRVFDLQIAAELKIVKLDFHLALKILLELHLHSLNRIPAI